MCVCVCVCEVLVFIAREKWEGPMLGPDDAADFLGINKVITLKYI